MYYTLPNIASGVGHLHFGWLSNANIGGKKEKELPCTMPNL